VPNECTDAATITLKAKTALSMSRSISLILVAFHSVNFGYFTITCHRDIFRAIQRRPGIRKLKLTAGRSAINRSTYEV
jgi:hypothetical protein